MGFFLIQHNRDLQWDLKLLGRWRYLETAMLQVSTSLSLVSPFQLIVTSRQQELDSVKTQFPEYNSDTFVAHHHL